MLLDRIASPFRTRAAASDARTPGTEASGPHAAPTAANDHTAEGWDPARVVLVVDDEAAIVESLEKIFKREGLTVLTATDGQAGLDLLRRHRVGVLLTDLMMPRTTGMDLLKAAKTVAPETEVVLMTAYGTVETAVDAMKEGAYDFVTKPLKRAHVVRIVRNALEKQSLVVENRALRAQLAERRQRAIIGTSLPWRRTMDVVVQAAASEATVMLLGESGTGKELLARALHDNSARAKGPFVAINCAAIPESILEAELFGYEKGAFTGADRAREGRFERRAAARCSSTRSARSRATCRSSCCACCRRARSSASAPAAARAASTSAWSPRPTSTSPPRSRPAGSARTSTTA